MCQLAAQVCDFNLSGVQDAGLSGSGGGGVSANNPRWLAPEVIRTNAHSTKSDVFSVRRPLSL